MLEQIRTTLLEEYSVSQWVLLFFLYSFCGWCWEVFLYLVKERRFVNRGFLFGPILPIYGFGAVGILLTCVPVEGNMALVALVGTIAASLLESMERYAKELQALHGGLDSINERVSGMIRDFAAHVDSRQEELAASAKRVTAARDRVREMMDQKRLSLEDGAKERFANLERVLNEAASYLPDVSALRAEVEAARAKYDRQSEELRRIRERRLLRAEHALRNNPTAASRRHRGPFEQLKRIQQRDEKEKKA